MEPKELIFSPEVEKSIKKLSKQDQRRIWEVLKRLSKGCESLQVEKIKANPSFFRVRAADYRVIYYPLSNGRVVLLLLGDRKQIYRRIANLDEKLATALRKLKVAN